MKLNYPFRGVLGLGKASTIYYLNEIQRRYQSEHEEFSTCPMLMYQIDFQEINPFLPDQFDILIPRIKNYINQIAELGISKLLVPNITLHETLDQMILQVKLCHPVNLTIEHLLAYGNSEVYIFGTSYTMNSRYLKKKFSDQNISLLKPNEKDQLCIDYFRTLVYKDEATTEQIAYFQNLIEKYADTHPVIIACTELSMHSLKNNAKCIDMADLQIADFLKV